MNSKKWIVVGVVVVVLIGVAIFASQSSKRAEYQANDMVISYDSSNPEAVASVDYVKEALEGMGVNVIAIDPKKDPKSIPMTDEANMEVEGAILYYQDDGEHVHESLIWEGGYFKSVDEVRAALLTDSSQESTATAQ